MPKLGTSGSVRGARGNSRPYRDLPILCCYGPVNPTPTRPDLCGGRGATRVPTAILWLSSKGGENARAVSRQLHLSRPADRGGIAAQLE